MSINNIKLSSYFSNKGIILNEEQIKIINNLDVFWKIKKSNRKITGCYLWGKPGRGKTMIMDAFSECAKSTTIRIHYHHFLRELHKNLIIKNYTSLDSLTIFANKIADNYKLFCLDEFHLHDIADTIMMERFFNILFKKKVFVILTSNYVPKSLLPDSKMHHHAQGIINMIEKELFVFQLDNYYNKDYRYNTCNLSNQYIYPYNKESETALLNYLNSTGLDIYQNFQPILIQKRKITPYAIGKYCIWFDFDTICLGFYSHLDYLEISEKWEVIVVSNISYYGLKNADGLRRFIWLVDILYDQKKHLFISSEEPIETMLSKLEETIDISRTISRLHEMKSAIFTINKYT
ncbi:cell division protein ZapE [Stenoxybacter acetivorans]|uniref:cell division protein ZapE n=1 Tax=Stenoxybacter acetivorans TaxID=422441 RepID=UPI000564E240|nr:cell division protein ZapE [Stenoxybacter acetivorans]